MNYTPIRMVALIILMLILLSSPSFGDFQAPAVQPQPGTDTFSSTKSTQDIRPLPPLIEVNDNYH